MTSFTFHSILIYFVSISAFYENHKVSNKKVPVQAKKLRALCDKCSNLGGICMGRPNPKPELLKGRILGSRIPDIFEENSGHLLSSPILFEILIDFPKINDLSIQMDSM